MYKIFRLLHRWLGIVSGFVLLLVLVSGAVLALKAEILKFSYAEEYYAPKSGEIKPVSELIKTIESKAKTQVMEITVTEGGKYYPARIRISGRIKNMYVNPYTAETLQIKHSVSFFPELTKFHSTLYLGEFGRQVVLISTILFVVIIITGTIRKIKISKCNCLKIQKNCKTTYLRLWQLHTVLGLFVALPLLVMSVTGILIHIEKNNAKNTQQEVVESEKKTENKLSIKKYISEDEFLDSIWGDINTNYYSVRNLKIGLPSASKKYFTLTLYPKYCWGENQSDKFKINSENYEIISAEYNNDNSFDARKLSIYHNLHYGLWAGSVSVILYLLSVILGVFFVISGYMMYLKRTKHCPCKKNKTKN